MFNRNDLMFLNVLNYCLDFVINGLGFHFYAQCVLRR